MKMGVALVCVGVLLSRSSAFMMDSGGPAGMKLGVQDGRVPPKHLVLDWYIETPAVEGHLYKEIGVSPSGEFLYAADPGTDAVIVLSTANPAVPIESFTHPSWAKVNVFPYAVDVAEDGMVYVSCFDIFDDGINDNAIWRWDPGTRVLQYLCPLPQPVRGIYVSGKGLNTVVYASGNGWPPSEQGIIIRCKPVTWNTFTAEVLFSTGVYRNQQDVASSHGGRLIYMSAWDHERREWLPDGPVWNPHESMVTLWDEWGNLSNGFSVSYFPRGIVPAVMFSPAKNRLYCLHLGIEFPASGGMITHEATVYKVNPKTGKMIDLITVGPSGTSGGGGIDCAASGEIYLAWTLGGGRSALAKVRDLTINDDQGQSSEASLPDGQFETTMASPLPNGFTLRQNYPNPFNPSTTIRFELPQSAAVRLSVCDMLGREIALLVEGRREAGFYEVVFDASDLSSGMYLCRLQAGEFVQTRKMLLTR